MIIESRRPAYTHYAADLATHFYDVTLTNAELDSQSTISIPYNEKTKTAYFREIWRNSSQHQAIKEFFERHHVGSPEVRNIEYIKSDAY